MLALPRLGQLGSQGGVLGEARIHRAHLASGTGSGMGEGGHLGAGAWWEEVQEGWPRAKSCQLWGRKDMVGPLLRALCDGVFVCCKVAVCPALQRSDGGGSVAVMEAALLWPLQSSPSWGVGMHGFAGL